MMKCAAHDVCDPGEWSKDLPVYVSDNAHFTFWGSFMFTRDAYLPGISKYWGSRFRRSRVGRRFPRLGELVWKLDDRIYLKGFEARTFPLVWKIKQPQLRSYGGDNEIT